MKGWMRRIRGAIGMGVSWALAWTPLGALFGGALGLLLGVPVPLGAVVVGNAITFGILGFVGGGLFSAVLSLTEGRSRFDQLSLPRFAGWGAVGGLLLGLFAVGAGFWGPGFQTVDLVILTVAPLLGSGSAAGTLALARAAEDRQLGPGDPEGSPALGPADS